LRGYDLNTGKELWHVEATSVELLRGFISDTEFLVLIDGTFTLVNATTGNFLWRRPFHTGWTGQGQGTLSDGSLYLYERQESTGRLRLLTLDRKTGQTIRELALESGEGIVFAMTDKQMVVVRRPKLDIPFYVDQTVQEIEDNKKEWITSVDTSTGKVNWRLSLPQVGSPFDDVRLFGDVLLQGDPALGSDEYFENGRLRDVGWPLTALDLATGATLWKRDHVMHANLAYKDVVFVAGANFLEGLERRTGNVLWSIPTADLISRPVIEDGVLYFGVRGNSGQTAERIDGIYAIPLDGNRTATNSG
jgi:outer membrane protein assembly factor BamB